MAIVVSKIPSRINDEQFEKIIAVDVSLPIWSAENCSVKVVYPFVNEIV